MTGLNLAGLVLSILFIALILTKKEKQIRDYFLAFFIFLLGTFLLIKYVFELNLYEEYPIVIYLDIYYWVLLGPALYIYTLLSTSGEDHLKTAYIYTLIPAFLVTILFGKYIFSDPTLFYSEKDIPGFYEFTGIFIWLFNSPIFYILTIITLYKHSKKIGHYYSFEKSVDFKWLFYLSNGFAVFIFFLLVQFTVRSLFNYNTAIDNYPISVIVTTIYIFGIGFFGYKQKGIFGDTWTDIPHFNPDLIENRDKNIQPQGNYSYKKSGLNKEEAETLLNNLQDLMEKEHPFLDCELDLPSLAKMMNVSTHKLSQVINEYIHKNFFDFINDYRIEWVKKLLTDPGNNKFKIISLAYESGFNSKSTFYTIFKKHEQVTPAEFRKNFQQKKGG